MSCPFGNHLVLFSLESWSFPRLHLGKHQVSRENKTNCFPRDLTLYSVWNSDSQRTATSFYSFRFLQELIHYVTQFTCKRQDLILSQRPKPRPGAYWHLVWSTDMFHSSLLYCWRQYHHTYYLLSWSNLREEDLEKDFQWWWWK